MSVESWLAGAGLIITILITGGGIVWAVGNMRTSILEQMAANRLQVMDQLNSRAIGMDNRISSLALTIEQNEAITLSRVGEGLSAIREKINQLELFVRDTYLPTMLYHRDQDQKWETIRTMFASIEVRIQGIDKKIDRLRHTNPVEEA